MDALTKKIDDFLGAQHATPEQVKEVAQECLDSKMLMDADQIKDLAEQINSATGRFTPPIHPTYILSRFCEECGQDQPGDGTASGRGGVPEDEGRRGSRISCCPVGKSREGDKLLYKNKTIKDGDIAP